MLGVGFEVFQLFIWLGNIVLAPQGGTPKAVYELVTLEHLLEPMMHPRIELHCPFELASFGFLQHEFGPATRREQILAHVGNGQNRQYCPQRKQNRIQNCRREIAPATRFKHDTRRFTERSKWPFNRSERIPKFLTGLNASPNSHKCSIQTVSRQHIVKKWSRPCDACGPG